MCTTDSRHFPDRLRLKFRCWLWLMQHSCHIWIEWAERRVNSKIVASSSNIFGCVCVCVFPSCWRNQLNCEQRRVAWNWLSLMWTRAPLHLKHSSESYFTMHLVYGLVDHCWLPYRNDCSRKMFTIECIINHTLGNWQQCWNKIKYHSTLLV